MQDGTIDLGFVYCWSRGIDSNDRVVLPSWNDTIARGNVLHAIVARGIAGNGSTPLIKRKFIDVVGGYDSSATLSEDWKFYTALASVCQFDLVPEYLVGYRLHDDNSTREQVIRMEQAIASCTAWIHERWPNLPHELLVEREHLANIYLAFIAIRNSEYVAAFRYICRAVRVCPSALFSIRVLRLVALLPLHAVGFRYYSWRFWEKRQFLSMPTS
jgi:hypothetical protein